MRLRMFFLIVILLLEWGRCPNALAQRDVRASIDSERGSDSFLDKKVFDKARSFIFRDSTYYLGHFFLGGYLYFRANDKLGFNKAIAPLQKALQLIETDYDQQLRTRTNSYVEYNAVYRYHSDYGFIAYLLEQCYQNVEMPDKAIEVLRHVRDRNFQVEQGVDSYNTMAWIYHRNRVYTSQKFPFLKNSIKENVAMANRLLDSALWKINDNMPMNSGLFDPSYLNHQYLSTFHYKAMIMDYKLEIDSANLYYDELIRYGRYSSNNYAEFKLAMGELPEADQYFHEAEQRGEYTGEKHTREYFYMRGTLDIYKGHPEMADTLLRKVLDEQGATPGYGWHCIGLSRAQHYEGLTDESQNRANKASRFQELHIGTTWGEEQYHLSVASLNYINQLQLKKEFLFENDQWWFWFNPVNWYEWLQYSLEIHQQKLVLASLVAENMERDQVLYSIFSSENLISFDEVWSLIDGIGNEYFIDVYKKKLESDKRPNLKKYFRYFLGKLYLAEGNDDEAIRYFQSVLDEEPNDDYQTLLYARVMEGMAMATSGSKRSGWMLKMYQLYPQLVPFSDLTMKFRLETSGDTDSDAASEILDDLKDCNLDFTSSPEAPTASLHFANTSDGVQVSYTVQTFAGRMINEGILRLTADQIGDGGRILGYKLFGINKEKIGEKPEAVKVPV